jgi:hypothetical protein
MRLFFLHLFLSKLLAGNTLTWKMEIVTNGYVIDYVTYFCLYCCTDVTDVACVSGPSKQEVLPGSHRATA